MAVIQKRVPGRKRSGTSAEAGSTPNLSKKYLDASILGLSASGEAELRHEVERGFSFQQWEALQLRASLNNAQLAELVGITVKTAGRRKAEGRLTTQESDRLVRLSRVIARATELFEGDEAAALHWLKSPRSIFQNKTPLDLARTEIGAREVERLIFQLEDGIFP